MFFHQIIMWITPLMLGFLKKDQLLFKKAEPQLDDVYFIALKRR